MKRDMLQALYAWSEWANAKLFHLAEQVSDEQYRRVSSSGYQSIHDTLVHNLGADLRWFGRWNGDPAPPFINPADFSTLASVRARWAELTAQRRAYIASLSEAQLDAEIQWIRADEQYSLPRWQAIVQAATHGVQHRSEIAAMLTDAGFSPGDLDFVWFCLQARA